MQKKKGVDNLSLSLTHKAQGKGPWRPLFGQGPPKSVLQGPFGQGRKNSWIFLTPNRSLSTFLQYFYEEIYKDDNTKPMKYV